MSISHKDADDTLKNDDQEVSPQPDRTEVQRTRQWMSSALKRLTPLGQTRTADQNMALAALTVACIGVFITALDQTVVVTALPQIISDLQIPITQLDHASWIISAYLLGFVVAMPLMGRVSDIHGRRRIFQLCLAIFGLGSLLCAIAPWLGRTFDLHFLNVFDAIHLHIDTTSPSLTWLISARLFQAIGGGALVPIAMAIASDVYGDKRRSLALGILGAVTEAGGVLGPLYGALIVEHFGWQYIFYLNIPLVIGLMIATHRFIPKGTRLQEGTDWWGAILLGLALTSLSLGLAQQGTSLGLTASHASDPQNNPIAIVLALLFFIAFMLVERKVRWPIVELSLFKRLPFIMTSLVSLLVGAALIIAMVDIPIFVDTVLQRPVLDSGLALMRLTVMIPIGALLGGWLCHYITCRFTAVVGLLFTAVGFYLMSRWPIDVSWPQMTLSTVTAGLGFGLVIAPISTTAINAVNMKQVGMSSAIVTALRMVGMILGLAALTSWALAYFKQLASTYPTLPSNANAGQFLAWSQGYAAFLIQSAHTVYSDVFFTSMIMSLVAIVPALFLWGRQQVQVTVKGPDETLQIPMGAPRITRKLSEYHPNLHPQSRHFTKTIISIGIILLLISLVFAASWLFNITTPSDARTSIGMRRVQLALDQGALTSVFVSQLQLQQGALTDMQVRPMPNDSLAMTLTLHIDANGIHRSMPIELDGTLGLDHQQNLQLHVTRLTRDGLETGPSAMANMQKAVNLLFNNTIMPTLRGQLKTVKLISAHTSATLACSRGAEMFVLEIEAPLPPDTAGQKIPTLFCLTGSIDFNKLFPH